MTLQGDKVPKLLLDVSGVIDKGNIVVFDDSGSFTLPGKCPGAAFVRKATAGVQGRIPLHAKKGIFVMRTWEPEDAPQVGFSRQGAPSKGRTPGRAGLDHPVERKSVGNVR